MAHDDVNPNATVDAVQARLAFWQKQRAHAESAGYPDGIATADAYIEEYTARLETLKRSMPGGGPSVTDTEI